MKPADLLFTQGFGTRRECAALVASGCARGRGRRRRSTISSASSTSPASSGFASAAGARWPYRERALSSCNKPAGYECSQKPRHHASVYSLLPAPLRQRGVQAIGRLDEDTTGVLLFTDDGTLVHRLTSPKHHVAKVYEVTLQARGRCRARSSGCCAGVLLHDDDATVRAAACEATGERTLRLTLIEGKYHQVKRMVAAVGNRVEALERSAFGPVRIDGLAAGAWRWLDADREFAAQR